MIKVELTLEEAYVIAGLLVVFQRDKRATPKQVEVARKAYFKLDSAVYPGQGESK